jgi:hypothetical protein
MRSISIGWTVTKIDSAQREKAERSWLFSVFSGMGHEENPKAETRNPKEVRNPKSEPVGLREAGSRECDEPELRLGPLRASAVGFLSDFGLRISGFGHELVPLKIAEASFWVRNAGRRGRISTVFISVDPTASSHDKSKI